jgi:hypothetical protein
VKSLRSRRTPTPGKHASGNSPIKLVLGWRSGLTLKNSVSYQGIALAIPQVLRNHCPFRGWLLNLEFSANFLATEVALAPLGM